MDSSRRSNRTQCPRSRTLADVPYIFVRGQSCASVRMISNLASKYRSVLDGFEKNKSRQVTQYPLTSTIPSGVYPKHIYTPQMLHNDKMPFLASCLPLAATSATVIETDNISHPFSKSTTLLMLLNSIILTLFPPELITTF